MPWLGNEYCYLIGQILIMVLQLISDVDPDELEQRIWGNATFNSYIHYRR